MDEELKLKTEEDVNKVLDDMFDEVKALREANMDVDEVDGFILQKPVNMPVCVEKSVRELKHRKSITFKTKLQINKRKYSIRQNNWFYGHDYEEEPTKDNLRDYWYLTNGTMKSIIKNHKDNFLVKKTSYFDGMTDGTEFVKNPVFTEPSETTIIKILDDLSRKGLMSCYYYPETGIFTCYSCCDSWKFSLKDVNIKFV